MHLYFHVFQDSEAYTYLLHQIAPKESCVTTGPMDVSIEQTLTLYLQVLSPDNLCNSQYVEPDQDPNCLTLKWYS